MLVFAFLAALAAAALNAGSAVLQRLAAGQPDIRQLFSANLAAQVATNRKFIAGIGLQVLGFLAQAVALSNGPLVVVQPTLTMDLVFLLLFIYFTVGVRAGVREWLAVGLICSGLSVLFVAARPRGGQLEYSVFPWIVIVLTLGAFVGVCVLGVRRLRSLKGRALLAGMAASGAFALNAAFTKLALNRMQQSGFLAMLTHWPVYALIISGIASLFLMENAYSAGPLAYSQPTLEITEPIISAIIGIVVFGDVINRTPLALTGELAGAALLGAGIVLLAGSDRLQRAGRRGL
jgi:drug/metabolite transporter (DMT)-like permease